VGCCYADLGWDPDLDAWCFSRQYEGVLFVFWIAWYTLQLLLLLPLMVFLCSGIRWSNHWRWTSETVLRWCDRDWWESRRTVNRRYRSPCTAYWYPLQTTRNCNRCRQQVTVFFHSVFEPWALSSPTQNYVRSHAILFLPFPSSLPLPFSEVESPSTSAFLCILDL